MTILKAIFGDWGKVFAPDSRHSDAIQAVPAGPVAVQARPWGQIPGREAWAAVIGNLLGVVSEQEVDVRQASAWFCC